MLAGATDIHILHLEDLQNATHPSLFEDHEQYRILILRLPEKINGKFKMHSYGFILIEEKIYRYDPQENSFFEFENGLIDFYRLLDNKIDALMNDIDHIQEKILLIEQSLYKRFSSKFMDHWHILKKELSRSEHIILKAADVLEVFISKTKVLPSFPLNEFNDLHEHLERALRANIAANTQLDNLYQYYNLRSNDRMNRSIYLLTVISVIFLPLNLVVGFFGMNTGGLPFREGELGTTYAFVSMILFAAILLFFVLWKINKK